MNKKLEKNIHKYVYKICPFWWMDFVATIIKKIQRKNNYIMKLNYGGKCLQSLLKHHPQCLYQLGEVVHLLNYICQSKTPIRNQIQEVSKIMAELLWISITCSQVYQEMILTTIRWLLDGWQKNDKHFAVKIYSMDR